MPATALCSTAKQILGNTSTFVIHLPRNVSEKLEEGMTVSRRAWKDARRSAEDLAQETAHRIKRHPFQATALTLGVGMGVGLSLGILLGRSARNQRSGISRWLP